MQTGPPPLKWSASTHAIHNTHFPSPSPLQPTSSTKIKQSSGRTIQPIIQSRGNLFLSCLFGILTKKKKVLYSMHKSAYLFILNISETWNISEKKMKLTEGSEWLVGWLCFEERERESERCCKPKSWKWMKKWQFQDIYCYQNTHHCTVVPFASRHHMRICCFHHLLNKALVQFLDNSGGCSWVFQFRDVGNLH